KIIFISDMYLGKSFLAKILHKNGYEEYDNLYVSSEHRVKKHSGELFDYVINDLGIEPQTILHIGDNVEADVKKAKSRNIKPF
ncbi:HAD-IA family hydrolase, partial [Escherichia coli]